jgi:hypothetical protein
MNPKEEGKTVEMKPNKEPAKAPVKPLTTEQVKRMRKEAAMELADYKRRLRESVELKKLQVEELELNIRYYHVSKEHEKIEALIQEEQAKKKAEAQKVMEEAKKQNESKIIVPDNKIIKP